MKSLSLWTLLIAGLVSLTACHWNHRHHHNFANSYHSTDYAKTDRGPADEISRAG